MKTGDEELTVYVIEVSGGGGERFLALTPVPPGSWRYALSIVLLAAGNVMRAALPGPSRAIRRFAIVRLLRARYIPGTSVGYPPAIASAGDGVSPEVIAAARAVADPHRETLAYVRALLHEIGVRAAASSTTGAIP
jgi:hypothetical protein